MIYDLKNKHRGFLKQAGLKATPERLSILTVLTKTKKPLSVRELKSKLKTSNIDQATIYRTMEALTEKSIVRPVNLQHGHNHYELADESHHHHITCEKCGKVVDILKPDTKDMEKQALKIGGFSKINNHSLEFFGVCKTCARKLI